MTALVQALPGPLQLNRKMMVSRLLSYSPLPDCSL